MQVIKDYTTAKSSGDIQEYIVMQLADANQFNANQQYMFTQTKNLESNLTETANTINSTITANKTASQLADTTLANSIAVLQTKSDAVNIMPNVVGVSTIGDATHKFGSIWTKELHIDANTLYVDGVAVIGSTAQTIQIGADINQGIRVATTGTGQTILDSQSATTIQTNGQNADVLIQTAGQGSKSRISSATEVTITAPLMNVNGNQNINGNLNIIGNISITGTTTSVNTVDMSVSDNVIVLNQGETGNGVTKVYAGIQVDRGALADSRIVWDESSDKFVAGLVGQEQSLATESFVTLGLDTKAPLVHTHTIAQITSLQTSLDGKLGVNANAVTATKLFSSKTIAGVAFDGSLNIDISYLNLTNKPTLGTSSSKDVAVAGDALTTHVVMGNDTRLTNARTPVAHTHTLSNISDFPVAVTATELSFLDGLTSSAQTQLNSKQPSLGFTPENVANKGVANGYASLDANGTIPSTQLPSYVDDVLEYSNLAGFPAVGTSGKIYLDLVTNKTYRWSGSAYVYITSGAVDSVNGQTGVVNISTITGNAGTATTLQTARSITMTGDVSYSVSFNGSANVTATGVLANTGVVAGDYQFVTVDAKGRVIAGSNFANASLLSLSI